MNRRLQDIRDLGHKCWETIKEPVAENKNFNEMQVARQTEKDIEFLSKPKTKVYLFYLFPFLFLVL
ncbi:hypothetical protein Hanom_Chr00s097895g01802191 [Helianthus anomalus]